jgi:hypothetical protein
MNALALLQLPFVQIALPLIITLAIAAWVNSKAFDTMNRRLDDMRADLKDIRADLKSFRAEVNIRFDLVDKTLKTYGEKIAVLEDRSSPLRR